MKSKLVADLHLTLKDEVQETYISFDESSSKLLLKEICIPYEIYKDDNGNVEIYIPENEFHTGFYIKLPKTSNN